MQIVDPGRRVITDEEGRFSFPVLLPDTVEVLATHVGYQDSRGSVAIGGAQAVTIQVEMARRVIPMDPIVVTATRREFTYALPGMEELDQRMKGGFGEFILPDQIQDRNPGRVTDLLYGTKVTVVNNGKAIYMSRTLCAPVVYIDDVRFTHGYASGGLQSIARSTPEAGAFQPGRGIDAQGEDDEGVFAAEAVNLVPPSDIAAIEIYPGPGSMPGQYIDSRSRCGVILIWTRRGPKG